MEFVEINETTQTIRKFKGAKNRDEAMEHVLSYNEDGKLRADVLSFPPTLTKDRDHPVEKPVELMEALIEPTTFEGGVVFDPFLGGGSTCIAAHNLNRKCLGMELDEDYFAIASKKINGAEKPLTDFF